MDSVSRFDQYGRRGQSSGIHYFASLALLRRCSAFIGHFGSAATWLAYFHLCYLHNTHHTTHHHHHSGGGGPQSPTYNNSYHSNSRQGSCPPSFDLRQNNTLVNLDDIWMHDNNDNNNNNNNHRKYYRRKL